MYIYIRYSTSESVKLQSQMQNSGKCFLDPQVFGQRIRSAREQMDMTQYDLADKLSRDQRAISEYERGTRRFPATDLPLLSSVLQVPLSYFFQENLNTYDLDVEIAEALEQLPDNDAKQALLAIIRLYVEQVNKPRQSA